MSSDILHYHHHHQPKPQPQPNQNPNPNPKQADTDSARAPSGGGGGGNRRGVPAMPNRSSELSRYDLAARIRAGQAQSQSQSQSLGLNQSQKPRRPTMAQTKNQAEDEKSTSPEQRDEEPTLESPPDGQQQAGKHAGPMGIFFKVWSLVKVTKSRHQQRQQQLQLHQRQMRQRNGLQGDAHKLRRQNSEDNSTYAASNYPIARSAAILQDRHFRRAGSQPAAVDRLQVARAAKTSGSCASSGIGSTTSSTLATNSASSPTTSSSLSPFRRPHFGVGPSKSITSGQQESWVARMRQRANNNSSSSSSARARLARAADSRQHPVSLSFSTSDGSRSSSELRDEPEDFEHLDDDNDADREQEDREDDDDEEEEDEEEEESNDIYSTPNDSIQSVPSGQRAPHTCLGDQRRPSQSVVSQTNTTNAPSRAFPMTRSFSTNNFQPAQPTTEQAQQQQHYQNQHLQQERENSSDSSRNSGKQLLSGSRFFISSSTSSEDSQTPKLNANLGAGAGPRQVDRPLPELPEGPTRQQAQLRPRTAQVNQGVHSHSRVARPQSLLLAGPQVGRDPSSQFVAPMHMLTPVGGGGGVGATATVYLGPAQAPLRSPASCVGSTYQRSPSLFEFATSNNTRFSSKYPPQLSSFQQQQQQQQLQRLQLRNAPPAPAGGQNLNQSRQSIDSNGTKFPASMMMSNSISMYDFKQQANSNEAGAANEEPPREQPLIEEGSEYKLAEMMLESGSNPNARDQLGNTTLMLAIKSDNLPAVKCLIEHGANLNETNLAGLGALDLVCTRQATPIRLEILKTLIDSGADLDCQRNSDGSRLLDRLIGEQPTVLATTPSMMQAAAWGQSADRMPFIECLLESGAKLSSSTWLAAQGKLEIQLCLLRKLCQDGYFLYKQSSIEAAVYRFEYALKRLAELEQQLTWMQSGQSFVGRRKQSALELLMAARSGGISPEMALLASRKIKYQTYLGLSRCERRRRFFKRALEFAHLAILVDSTSYEAFYSKAHILKDLGEIDDSLLTIDQTARLIERTIENCQLELKFLGQQEESLIMESTCFELNRDACRKQSALLARNRLELGSSLDYLLEAKKYVAKLRQDIMDDKFKSSSNHQQQQQSATNDAGDSNTSARLATVLSAM